MPKPDCGIGKAQITAHKAFEFFRLLRRHALGFFSHLATPPENQDTFVGERLLLP